MSSEVPASTPPASTPTQPGPSPPVGPACTRGRKPPNLEDIMEEQPSVVSALRGTTMNGISLASWIQAAALRQRAVPVAPAPAPTSYSPGSPMACPAPSEPGHAATPPLSPPLPPAPRPTTHAATPARAPSLPCLMPDSEPTLWYGIAEDDLPHEATASASYHPPPLNTPEAPPSPLLGHSAPEPVSMVTPIDIPEDEPPLSAPTLQAPPPDPSPDGTAHSTAAQSAPPPQDDPSEWRPLASILLSLQRAIRGYHAQALTCPHTDAVALRSISDACIQHLQSVTTLLQHRDLLPPASKGPTAAPRPVSRADTATSWRSCPPATASPPASASPPATVSPPATCKPSTPTPCNATGKRPSTSFQPPPKRGQQWRNWRSWARFVDFWPYMEDYPSWPAPKEAPPLVPVRRSHRLVVKRSQPSYPWFCVSTPGEQSALSQSTPPPPTPPVSTATPPLPTAVAATANRAAPPEAAATPCRESTLPSSDPPSEPPSEEAPSPAMRRPSYKRSRATGPGGGDE